MAKLFRYTGSKHKLVDSYKKPPLDTKRIVEVFAGSMCYALSYRKKYDVLGIEINKQLYGVYKWLLNKPDLDNTIEKFEKYTENFDIRNATEFIDGERESI
ncbi:MAG: DNA adenine methylase [Bacilli bacterium]